MLKRARRASLVLFTVLSVLGFFGVLHTERGRFWQGEYTEFASANGALIYIHLHPTTAPTNTARWITQFRRFSDFEPGVRNYQDIFNWRAVGFRFMSGSNPGFAGNRASPPRPPLSYTVVGAPYWPILLALIYPELRAWLRELRVQAIQRTPKVAADPYRVTRDLPCVHCGYNLRTMHGSACCPECGKPVMNTLSLDRSLSASRPGWLQCLVAANVSLLLSRVAVVVAFVAAFSNNYAAASAFAIATGAFEALGTWLLTCKEHPHQRPHDRKLRIAVRLAAIASLLCIVTGIQQQCSLAVPVRWRLTILPQTPLSDAVVLSGEGYWRASAIVLMFAGWLLHCATVALEFRCLTMLGKRLGNCFLLRHSRTAGFGLCVSGVAALSLVRIIDGWYSFASDRAEVWPSFAILILWLIFVGWAGFVNVYGAIRLTQQAWLAAERWRTRSPVRPATPIPT